MSRFARRKDAIKAAAEAHTNLNTFAAVASLLEGGHLYGARTHAAASRIIAICKKEQHKWLMEYDRQSAKAQQP